MPGGYSAVREIDVRAAADPWLARMLARKPKMLVAVAFTNGTAWVVWALTTKKEIYRARAAA